MTVKREHELQNIEVQRCEEADVVTKQAWFEQIMDKKLSTVKER